ncbi:hypothetical protein [Mesobacillus foraminis]|uniref:hypothetical protein n=1 Tax=Mesobacillus foraminis TaxID=279826 RepID=UPI0013CF0026|nr:hypothetical protein [Mesobacillus foraminis]
MTGGKGEGHVEEFYVTGLGRREGRRSRREVLRDRSWPQEREEGHVEEFYEPNLKDES